MNARAGQATRRADKARANRHRMRAAALALFTERGYAATSMQAIADAAGMAVQTLYFTFGTKRALLSEILDIAVAGDEEPVPTLERPGVLAAIDDPDPEQSTPRAGPARPRDLRARRTRAASRRQRRLGRPRDRGTLGDQQHPARRR